VHSFFVVSAAAALIDVSRLVAVDVHTHAEISASGHLSLPPELASGSRVRFKVQAERPPTVPEMAGYFRARRMAAVVFTVDAESATGHPSISILRGGAT